MPSKLFVAGLIAATLLVSPAHAGEVEARIDAELVRMLTARFDSWADDIAGFNLRHAGCDAARAEGIAAYDATHGTTFERKLGWKYQAAAWQPAPIEQAEITLTYSGPVGSGTVTTGGTAHSFCRAETPDKLVVTGEYPRSPSGEHHSESLTASLPVLPPGFAAAAAPAVVGDTAATPDAEIDARIERAKAALETGLKDLGKVAAEERRKGVCPKDKVAQWTSLDGSPISQWTREKSFKVEVAGIAYSGPAHEEDGRAIWLCHVMRPDRVTTSAIFEQEGENRLLFTTAVPVLPVP